MQDWSVADSAQTAPTKNATRPLAAWAAIAAPRMPTVSRMAWGLSTETPTAWATVTPIVKSSSSPER